MTDTKQPEKPIAYFDFQDRGFYWAPNTAIGPVPVARKVEPMPLYSSHQQAQPELTCVCGAVWEGSEMVHAPRAQPERAPLTDYQKLDIVTNWFTNDDDITRALQILTDYDQTSGIKQGGAA